MRKLCLCLSLGVWLLPALGCHKKPVVASVPMPGLKPDTVCAQVQLTLLHPVVSHDRRGQAHINGEMIRSECVR